MSLNAPLRTPYPEGKGGGYISGVAWTTLVYNVCGREIPINSKKLSKNKGSKITSLYKCLLKKFKFCQFLRLILVSK